MPVEHIELTQTADMTDSYMIEQIQEMIGEGWELFSMQEKRLKVWTFQREANG